MNRVYGEYSVDPSELISPRCSHEYFLLLERHVNDGSPSGFTEKYNASPGHRAEDHITSFELPYFDLTDSDRTAVGRTLTLGDAAFPVHPDMEQRFSVEIGKPSAFRLQASPMSSGRTLSVGSEQGPFIVKLAYQGLLGRVTRRMTRSHVLSAIEVSSSLEQAIDRGQLPEGFHIYREHGGIFFREDSNLRNWGFVERAIAPFPEGRFIEIPAFSLISEKNSAGIDLFEAVMSINQHLRDADYLLESMIYPVIDSYFSSIIKLGLQLEAHSQNIVFLFDEKMNPRGFALRDMESVDKDLPIIDKLGMSSQYTKTEYKFLRESDYNYQIMHSFMFDFKFCQYLLDPLLRFWAKHKDASKLEYAREKAKERVLGYSNDLPGNFFPEGVWYDYDAVVHEGSKRREYRSHAEPPFR